MYLAGAYHVDRNAPLRSNNVRNVVEQLTLQPVASPCTCQDSRCAIAQVLVRAILSCNTQSRRDFNVDVDKHAHPPRGASARSSAPKSNPTFSQHKPNLSRLSRSPICPWAPHLFTS